jgi:hypothetical protein
LYRRYVVKVISWETVLLKGQCYQIFYCEVLRNFAKRFKTKFLEILRNCAKFRLNSFREISRNWKKFRLVSCFAERGKPNFVATLFEDGFLRRVDVRVSESTAYCWPEPCSITLTDKVKTFINDVETFVRFKKNETFYFKHWELKGSVQRKLTRVKNSIHW